MKKVILILLTILSSVTTMLAQSSDYSKVEQTISNYMTGSSYNNIEQLESAFAENATLYLSSKDGFKRYTPEEYSAFFKNKEKGVFNGRHGKILSIEIHQDVAMAKAEILIPKANLRFMDLFLFKKIDSEWKIISKTAARILTNKAD